MIVASQFVGDGQLKRLFAPSRVADGVEDILAVDEDGAGFAPGDLARVRVGMDSR